ncbi:MAG: 16S rRNA (adenine(1518)-N(6)/adenine(1519)-N(6))-dimethyltransferase RsmA [bacterium]|jgi:16S rRNA (adenine1518-N6/adenine1519-N6)-dimethyltransferase|nr:16S rRNA (adenine(1518)-N(6)/adenine(1519)-N(6))-dimethyltransferase RsmA [bacterium]
MPSLLSTVSCLYKPSQLTLFLENHAIRLTKALGQNYFIDRHCLAHILEQHGLPTEGSIIEIGPGIGNLTWLLIDRGLTVHAVEKDGTVLPILDELSCEAGVQERLHLIHSDALDTDIATLARESGAHHVIGNLPYNVAVPILFHVAYCGAPFQSIGVMLQKEVGDRIMAHPEDKAYGRLSIVLKYLYTITKIKTIPPACYFPRPKVESVFIKMVPNPDVDLDFCQNYLERVVRIGFLHRRKKLRAQFKGSIVERRILGNHLDEIETQFDLDQRGEAWPVEEWIRFARFVQAMPQDG